MVVKNELSKRLQRYEAKSNLGENCQIKKVRKNITAFELGTSTTKTQSLNHSATAILAANLT